MIQIDEPFLAGYPDDVDLAVEAINVVTKDVEAEWGLHVCYGNRYARPSWEGHYDFLFPAVLDANVDQLVLEFARKGYDDLEVVARGGWDRKLGLGVIDVKSRRVEPPELIESADPPGRRRAGARNADRQPRLRPAAPAGRHRPGQARRDGRGQRGRAGRAAARRPGGGPGDRIPVTVPAGPAAADGKA